MTDARPENTEAPVEEQVDRADEVRTDADGVVVEETTAPEGAAEAPAPGDPLAETQQALAERTADLQRLQAEFLNYKRRVERDRELVRENATYAALAPIVDVLDTIDRAREHEPLEGGFKAVAEQLERVVSGLGLVKFGAPGDAFDPSLHEALSHIGTDPGVEVTTCKVIAKAGYKIGDRVVRAAQVLVVDPAEPTVPGEEPAATPAGQEADQEPEPAPTDPSRTDAGEAAVDDPAGVKASGETAADAAEQPEEQSQGERSEG